MLPDRKDEEIVNRSKMGVEGTGGRSWFSLICSAMRLLRSIMDSGVFFM